MTASSTTETAEKKRNGKAMELVGRTRPATKSEVSPDAQPADWPLIEEQPVEDPTVAEATAANAGIAAAGADGTDLDAVVADGVATERPDSNADVLEIVGVAQGLVTDAVGDAPDGGPAPVGAEPVMAATAAVETLSARSEAEPPSWVTAAVATVAAPLRSPEPIAAAAATVPQIRSRFASIIAEPDSELDQPAARPAPRIRGIDDAAPTDFEGEAFLTREKLPPTAGWRRALWRASGGRVTPEPSAADLRQRACIDRIQARTSACQRIAVASAKGGVGKTTATVLLGTAMAMHRLDRVIAIDANPDAGSLGWRVERETESALTDMLRHAGRIERYSDVRAFTSQAKSRLEILASELDPAVSQALVEEDYATVINVLERFYSVVLCDLGTGLLDSATQGLIGMAGQLVVVTSPSLDGGRVANFTLDFIERRHPAKVANAVVIINNVRNDGLVDVAAMRRHFGLRVRSVVTIPYDRHLANGAIPNWALLKHGTQDAYLEAAAAVADGFQAT